MKRKSPPTAIIDLGSDDSDSEVQVIYSSISPASENGSKRRKTRDIHKDLDNCGLFSYLPSEILVNIIAYLPARDSIPFGCCNRWLLRTVWACIDSFDMRTVLNSELAIETAKRGMVLCEKVHELRIRNVRAEPPVYVDLIRHIPKCWPRLSRLDLRGCQTMSQDVLNTIFACISLTDLSLRGCNLQDMSIATIVSLTNLRRLDLSHTALNRPDEVESCLKNLPLEKLRIAGITLYPPRNLLNSLNKLTSLEIAVLPSASGYQLTQLKADVVPVGAVSSCKSISALSLDRDGQSSLAVLFQNLTRLAIPSLELYLLHLFPTLESLTVRRGIFSLPSVAENQHLEHVFASLTYLKCGSASFNSVSCYVDNIFSSVKHVFPSLRSLKLVGAIEDPSRLLEPWVSTVPKMTSLQSLWLQNCNTLTNDVVLTICKKLPNLLDLVILQCDQVTWKSSKFMDKRFAHILSLQID